MAKLAYAYPIYQFSGEINIFNFARGPWRSYFDEPRKNEIYFLNVNIPQYNKIPINDAKIWKNYLTRTPLPNMVSKFTENLLSL